MATFINSSTETAVRKTLGISDATWNSLDATQKKQLLSKTLEANPKLLEGTVKASADKNREVIKGKVATQSKLLDDQVALVDKTQADVTKKIKSIQNTLNQLNSDRNIEKYRYGEMQSLREKLTNQIKSLTEYSDMLSKHAEKLLDDKDDLTFLSQKMEKSEIFSPEDVTNYSIAVGRLTQKGTTVSDEAIKQELALMEKEAIEGATGDYLNLGGSKDVSSLEDLFGKEVTEQGKTMTDVNKYIGTVGTEVARDFGGELQNLSNKTDMDRQQELETVMTEVQARLKDNLIPSVQATFKGHITKGQLEKLYENKAVRERLKSFNEKLRTNSYNAGEIAVKIMQIRKTTPFHQLINSEEYLNLVQEFKYANDSIKLLKQAALDTANRYLQELAAKKKKKK